MESINKDIKSQKKMSINWEGLLWLRIELQIPDEIEKLSYYLLLVALLSAENSYSQHQIPYFSESNDEFSDDFREIIFKINCWDNYSFQ